MAEKSLPLTTSLVRYDNAVLVSKHDEKKDPVPGTSAALEPQIPTSSGDKRDLLAEARRECQEILNVILPPREWEEENGQLWRQQVSSTPATRLDVVKLQEQLDAKLQELQARETGICAVRRELYTQCFDEIIRHVTINCAERGMLLLRVRDELFMTIEAYQILYASSVAFGIRKTLLTEENKCNLAEDVKRLTEEKAALEKQLLQQQIKYELTERRNDEQRGILLARHKEKIDGLERTNQQLKAQLEGIIAVKKN